MKMNRIVHCQSQLCSTERPQNDKEQDRCATLLGTDEMLCWTGNRVTPPYHEGFRQVRVVLLATETKEGSSRYFKLVQ